ncbi:tRNA N6-adenosine threonylcarbamoyltransferase [Phytophthora nicotianae]|uniref:tRNA N6-adenosine threonylcarbamoyltransferase n=1 Tax=Phytophthora nicotianae TaxID=4792 RepID=A0A0W8D729_PHYNI|nr:tRNA N6-adenosine threonylcarbamoyltransferase [Phytophthora nicotianae]
MLRLARVRCLRPTATRHASYLLGIETSCDDTAAAVLDQDGRVLSNVISSQWELNAKWRGIVPALAARAHEENLPHVINAAIEQRSITWRCCNYRRKRDMIFLAVADFACVEMAGPRPSVTVATTKSLGDYELLGNTLDDSIGEAYDKVARMLDITASGGKGVHGGKLIEDMAARGDDRAFPFTEPMKHRKLGELDEKMKEDLCASFQVVCGGVASNQYLRGRMQTATEEEGVVAVFPPAKYCTDNGVMIAWAGLERYAKGMRSDPECARYQPRWPLETLQPL